MKKNLELTQEETEGKFNKLNEKITSMEKKSVQSQERH